MSDNPFTRGETHDELKAFLDRKEKSLADGFDYQRRNYLDIDGLPTATTVNGKAQVIDEVFRPDPENRYFNAYGDTPISDQGIEYFKKNPNVSSIDFNVSYPGYAYYDYHPLRKSDPRQGFQPSANEFNRRSAIFADSLKDRVARVNEVFDAHPEWPTNVTDPNGFHYNSKGEFVGDAPIRRINFTPEDSKNLSESLNRDLLGMFQQAPEGTTFVNNPDSKSRGRLYSRSANFSPADEANNQFVVKGPRGSLQSLQITDPNAPALGPSNFDTNPGPIRTIREIINPDSVEEIRNLPKFQRQLYQKPEVKVPSGKKVAGGGVLADVGVGAAMSYLTGETDNPAVAAYSGLTGLIPESTNTAMGTMPMVIDGKEYHKTQEPSRVIGPDGQYQGLEILNGKPRIVPYGGGAAGRAPIHQPLVDTAAAIGDTARRRTSQGKWRFAGAVMPELGLSEMLGLN